jgi:hypothetical protein
VDRPHRHLDREAGEESEPEQVCASGGKSVLRRRGMLVVPAKFTIHSIATSISTEPSSV